MNKRSESDKSVFAVVVPDPDNPRKTRTVKLTREQLLAIGDAPLPTVNRFGIPPSPLFRDMDDVAITEIGRRGRQRQLSPGSTICHQGEVSDSVYLVVSGRVRSTVRDRNNRDWSFFDLASAGVGDIIGSSAEKWVATTAAVTETLLLQIPRSDWRELLHAYPQLAVNFAAYLAEKIEEAQRRFAAFAGSFTAQKIAMVLIGRAAVSGTPGKAGWVDIPEAITHDEIASAVGTTREAVVTAMRQLDGDIITRNGKLYSINIGSAKQFIDK